MGVKYCVQCFLSDTLLGACRQILSFRTGLIPLKTEEPSQRGWELEDKKLGRNAVIWEADGRKMGLSGGQRVKYVKIRKHKAELEEC